MAEPICWAALLFAAANRVGAHAVALQRADRALPGIAAGLVDSRVGRAGRMSVVVIDFVTNERTSKAAIRNWFIARVIVFVATLLTMVWIYPDLVARVEKGLQRTNSRTHRVFGLGSGYKPRKKTLCNDQNQCCQDQQYCFDRFAVE